MEYGPRLLRGSMCFFFSVFIILLLGFIIIMMMMGFVKFTGRGDNRAIFGNCWKNTQAFQYKHPTERDYDLVMSSCVVFLAIIVLSL